MLHIKAVLEIWHLHKSKKELTHTVNKSIKIGNYRWFIADLVMISDTNFHEIEESEPIRIKEMIPEDNAVRSGAKINNYFQLFIQNGQNGILGCHTSSIHNIRIISTRLGSLPCTFTTFRTITQCNKLFSYYSDDTMIS